MSTQGTIIIGSATCIPLEDGYMTLVSYNGEQNCLSIRKSSKKNVKRASFYDKHVDPIQGLLTGIMITFALLGLIFLPVNLANIVYVLTGAHDQMIAPISSLIALVFSGVVFTSLLILLRAGDKSYTNLFSSSTTEVFTTNARDFTKNKEIIDRFLLGVDFKKVRLKHRDMMKHLSPEDFKKLYEGQVEHNKIVDSLAQYLDLAHSIDKERDPDLYAEAESKVEEYGEKYVASFKERSDTLNFLSRIITENRLADLQSKEYEDS